MKYGVDCPISLSLIPMPLSHCLSDVCSGEVWKIDSEDLLWRVRNSGFRDEPIPSILDMAPRSLVGLASEEF
jgi:hypothetical protein